MRVCDVFVRTQGSHEIVGSGWRVFYDLTNPVGTTLSVLIMFGRKCSSAICASSLGLLAITTNMCLYVHTHMTTLVCLKKIMIKLVYLFISNWSTFNAFITLIKLTLKIKLKTKTSRLGEYQYTTESIYLTVLVHYVYYWSQTYT